MSSQNISAKTADTDHRTRGAGKHLLRAFALVLVMMGLLAACTPAPAQIRFNGKIVIEDLDQGVFKAKGPNGGWTCFQTGKSTGNRRLALENGTKFHVLNPRGDIADVRFYTRKPGGGYQAQYTERGVYSTSIQRTGTGCGVNTSRVFYS